MIATGEYVHIVGIGPGHVARHRFDDRGDPIVTVTRDRDGVEHLCREFEFGKVVRMSVSWLGHKDASVENFDEAKALIEGYAKSVGMTAVIGDFAMSEKFKDYGCYGGSERRWDRANWTFVGQEDSYEGCIVVVCELPKPVKLVKLTEALKHPEEFFYKEEEIPRVVDKMIAALAVGNAHPGPAAKAAARACGGNGPRDPGLPLGGA